MAPSVNVTQFEKETTSTSMRRCLTSRLSCFGVDAENSALRMRSSGSRRSSGPTTPRKASSDELRDLPRHRPVRHRRHLQRRVPQAALYAYRLAQTFSPVHIYKNGECIATVER